MAQSRTAVNAKASGAEPMQKLTDTGAVPAGGETQQVGGPTPENYKSDDESAKVSANAPAHRLQEAMLEGFYDLLIG